jgi:hypothetical protein
VEVKSKVQRAAQESQVKTVAQKSGAEPPHSKKEVAALQKEIDANSD